MLTRFTLAIALSLIASGIAHAQGAPRPVAPAMKPQELKSSLYGIRMEGVTDDGGFRWRECIDPNGRTVYETPSGQMNGRLTISAKGACFAYEDDNYASTNCFVTRRSAKGFRFEGAFGSTFTTTKVEAGVRTCEKQDLIG
jgi:hypothetical protein